ncbi:Retrovirus-related Pol polyprotein [Aphis craccivora]|uniref:Retrovirus-related Pol polyprotein n=1 Tax=Aphis craccivora TaxID=307492 RepID=A0A6G0VV16_APHCR|nr:Retrovirus-related Pol polyprotein [Aphis craccivora]
MLTCKRSEYVHVPSIKIFTLPKNENTQKSDILNTSYNIISNQNFAENKNKDNKKIIINTECGQRVSMKVEIDGTEKYAILDTCSNLSCIDYSLTKNKQLIKPEENIIIRGADNTELKQLGKTEITIKIKDYHYLINGYVIKGLHCKLLLGNDFNIKNNNVIMPMDNNWYDYHKNNITNKYTKINYITSINYNKRKENQTKNENITTPHEPKLKYKNINTDTNKNEKKNKEKHYLKLETQILNNNEKCVPGNTIQNLYTQTYKGMTIGKIEKTNDSVNKETILTIINKPEQEISDKQGTIIRILNELNNEQREKAKSLINKYKHLFTSDPLDIDGSQDTYLSTFLVLVGYK